MNFSVYEKSKCKDNAIDFYWMNWFELTVVWGWLLGPAWCYSGWGTAPRRPRGPAALPWHPTPRRGTCRGPMGWPTFSVGTQSLGLSKFLWWTPLVSWREFSDQKWRETGPFGAAAGPVCWFCLPLPQTVSVGYIALLVDAPSKTWRIESQKPLSRKEDIREMKYTSGPYWVQN